jgi:spore coat polysaccharide biosynthesis predicted glycosyltransferase SpsG
MNNKISIIVSGSSNAGLGHISRMSSLISEFEAEYDFTVIVLDDEKKFSNNFFTVEPKHINSLILESYLLHKIQSKNIIFDVAKINLDKLSFILKDKYRDEMRIVALDYFESNHAMDIVFNLFNQKNKSFKSEAKNTRVGLEYTIINPVLKKIKKTGSKMGSNILVRLSSKIPREYLNILQSKEIIDILDKKGLLVDENIKISKDEFTDKLIKSQLYIGGGATTALESLYLGNTVIFFPSNEKEHNFGMALNSCTTNFHLIDTTVHSYKYFALLLKDLLTSTSSNALGKPCKIDGLGASRILKGLLKNE